MIEQYMSRVKQTGLAVASILLVAHGGGVAAQTASQAGLDKGQYIPNVWVDPDGCEHWVMDDGIEGYMTPHVTRDGKPVCRDGNICAMLKTDTFFETDKFAISTDGVERITRFFQQSEFRTFSIAGHTDSVASDAYNLTLSRNRAEAVAAVARAAGARISTVTGYGERKPAASNATPNGRAKNRRVEIMCVR
ncbi:MAG: OmpA family protein [Roseobacter sp.]